MPRSRTVKPSICTNEELARCAPIARLLFIYLWMHADRAGRLEDRPLRIKADCLPFDSVEIDALLNELQNFGFIVRYAVKRHKYIQIINFTKHQRPHPKEPESSYLPWKKTAGCALTLTPNTPSISHSHTLSATADGADALRVSFERFVELFPKKTHRKPAWLEWAKLRPDADLVEKIMSAIRAQQLSHRWQSASGRYVPNPARWLANAAWDDQLEPDAVANSAPARASPRQRPLDKLLQPPEKPP